MPQTGCALQLQRVPQRNAIKKAATQEQKVKSKAQQEERKVSLRRHYHPEKTQNGDRKKKKRKRKRERQKMHGCSHLPKQGDDSWQERGRLF